MKSPMEQCDDTIAELIKTLHSNTHRPAIHDVNEAVALHLRLTELHLEATLRTKFLTRRAHHQAAAQHEKTSREWGGAETKSPVMRDFGYQKSLFWILCNYTDDDNGGVTRALLRKSDLAIAKSTYIFRWGRDEAKP